ncbi:MAG: VOC family protein [Desulfomonilaceae bacterium]|nr:VOC family protein [Desulfomonilaceae bacterium]
MKCLMDHIVLNVEDDETMISFYSEVLRLPTERLEEYRAGDVPFASLRLNADTIIDLFPRKLWQKNSRQGEGRENLNHFCITVAKADWDALVNRLEAQGIQIESGPVRLWGAQGTGTSIYFRDPEKNLIEARHYEAEDDEQGRVS